MNGITSIVDHALGRSRIPESAKPVTLPSLMEPERPAGKKRKPATKSAKPNNEAVILGALDYREGRTADEVAQRAGVSRWLVYKYLRRFLDLRLVVDASVWRKSKRTGLVTQFVRGKRMQEYRALLMGGDA